MEIRDDVSSKVQDAQVSSTVKGDDMSSLNAVSWTEASYSGRYDNSDRSLQAGDYFTIKLDEKVKLDGVTTYGGFDMDARSVEQIGDASTQEHVIDSVYNVAEHTLYYDFTNTYAGSPYTYSNTVSYDANVPYGSESAKVSVQGQIVASDVVGHRYGQVFVTSPRPQATPSPTPTASTIPRSRTSRTSSAPSLTVRPAFPSGSFPPLRTTRAAATSWCWRTA